MKKCIIRGFGITPTITLFNKKIAGTLTCKEGQRNATESNFLCDELPENCSLGQLYSLAIQEATKEGCSDVIDITAKDKTPKEIGKEIAPRVDEFMKTLDVRRLTPLECYRLMGFDDEDCDNARAVLSDTMLYHTAGDSIVVDVLEAIFRSML